MSKLKASRLLEKPSKKKQPSTPQSADDYQELADEEESRGGKWRAGDITKSSRAFQRALTFYDQGISRYPDNYDLAYNRARLHLEISQYPLLLSHFGSSLSDFLVETLTAHREALVLNDDDVNLLFNTAQVLTSLAEERIEESNTSEAISALHEALELLLSCLAKQEMLLEQQSLLADKADEDHVEGGVALNDGQPSNLDKSKLEETVRVEEPITPADLLDTVHASMSALTTLVQSEQEHALPRLESLAEMLLGKKAPSYLELILLPDGGPKTSLELDRAIFACALANAKYSHHIIDLQSYVQTLDLFDIEGKADHADILSAEGEARSELVLSMLDESHHDQAFGVLDCWKHLTMTQDLYTTATKLTNDEAQEMKPDIYKRKGDVELLRFRLATMKRIDVSDSLRNSSATLLKNAQTYYKGAIKLGHSAKDHGSDAVDRLKVAEFLAQVQDGLTGGLTEDLKITISALVDEGLINPDLDATFLADP